MKTQTKIVQMYTCDYCGEMFYNTRDAGDHEQYHKVIGELHVGDTIEYTKQETETDWGREYNVTNKYKGVIKIVRVDEMKILVEHDDLTTDWVYSWLSNISKRSK